MKPDEYRSFVPGAGTRPLGDHRDAPLSRRGRLLWWSAIGALTVVGIVLVAVSR